jgi:hypothetical protein
VTAEEWPVVLGDLEGLDSALGIADWAGFAAQHGLISRAQVDRWGHELATAVSAGTFRYSFSIFITLGRRA